MRKSWVPGLSIAVVLVGMTLGAWRSALAAKLTVDLSGLDDITTVGAINRWDEEGNARHKVKQDAKIPTPELDAKATREGSQWVFNDIPQGKYDLVLLSPEKRLRIEGFTFPPILEFDPFLPITAQPEDEAREEVVTQIANQRHYENKVSLLYLAGNKEAIRVLMMLIRDKTTSYEGDMKGASTLRHELWQFSFQHGGWNKEKRTRVLDRQILPLDELRKWTWLWDPKLGGIEVKKSPVTFKYEMPGASGENKTKGLYPY